MYGSCIRWMHGAANAARHREQRASHRKKGTAGDIAFRASAPCRALSNSGAIANEHAAADRPNLEPNIHSCAVHADFYREADYGNGHF